MKIIRKFVIALARLTGAYNEIYFTAWRDVGQQMATDRLYWHQSKLPSRNAIANAFHLYSKSLFFGSRPNMEPLRAEVDALGNDKHPEIKSIPYIKNPAETRLQLVTE